MAREKISYSVYCIIQPQPTTFFESIDYCDDILMVRDNYRDHKLSLPGGGMEQGELITETAIREVKEETGFDIEVGKLVGIFSHRKQKGIVIVFFAEIKGGQKIESSEEISWCGCVNTFIHDPNDIYPAQLGMIKQFLGSNESQWPIYNHMIPPL